MIRRPEDIDLAILNLNKAMDAHLEWVVNVLDACLNDGELRDNIMSSSAHKRCRFSRWLRKVSPLDEAEKTCIAELNTTHHHMHDTGRQLVSALIRGEMQSELVDAFRHALITFSGVLIRYKTWLIALRSQHDNLTGLPLRQLLNDTFDNGMVSLSGKYPYLLLMDVDYFKKINDTLGHLAGDNILRCLASELRKSARQHDCVFRYGGEEFILILYASSDTTAADIAARIGLTISRHSFVINEKRVGVTLTSGITRIFPGDTLEKAVSRADKALYEGKKQGRNRAMFINSQHSIALINAA